MNRVAVAGVLLPVWL